MLHKVIKDYEFYVNRLKKVLNCDGFEYHYEVVDHNDLKFNLHIHGYCEMHHLPSPKDFKFQKGYHVWWEQVNPICWHRYITKDDLSKERAIRHIEMALNPPLDEILDDISDGSLEHVVMPTFDRRILPKLGSSYI